MAKRSAVDIRLEHIEDDIKGIKQSLETQTEILKDVAVQDEKLKAIDLRLQIAEKKIEKSDKRTKDWLWNALTMFISASIATVISFWGWKK